MDIEQQISNFVRTETGVNDSPTLTKRELKTTVGMQNGDVIILGGLSENKDAANRDGPVFLPKFMHTRGHEKSNSEILLVLQVEKITESE